MNATLQRIAETMTSNAESTVAELSEQKRETDKKIQNLFYSIMSNIPAMEDEGRFWKLLDILREKSMNKFVTERYGKAGRFKHGTSAFAWEFAFGKCSEDFYELLSFIKTYNQKSAEVSKKLWDVVEGLGDDSYGDFIDSFLMHGRETYEAALQGKLLKSQNEMELGENYVRTNLEEGAIQYFESYAFSKAQDEKEDF